MALLAERESLINQIQSITVAFNSLNYIIT